MTLWERTKKIKEARKAYDPCSNLAFFTWLWYNNEEKGVIL